MSEEDDGADEPTVELGPGEPVTGAPIQRVAARLTWPKKRSDVVRLEGATTVRTPDGPRELAVILEDGDVSYFERRREFVTAVESVIGTGPIPTE
ncbi:hypothetical protein BRD17_08515 [Halobacteriales archaeon SW_7_68_16]|nr:MAG: hypothetical protein BRD17_08515 [Halobacteriales archaeon SW_7_68_16]